MDVISSLVIDAVQGREQEVAYALVQLDPAAVEVHEIVGSKLVVTIEAQSTERSHSIANAFVKVPGVINVNLIYHNFEDEAFGQ